MKWLGGFLWISSLYQKSRNCSRTLTIRETGICGKRIMTLTSNRWNSLGWLGNQRRVMDSSIRGTWEIVRQRNRHLGQSIMLQMGLATIGTGLHKITIRQRGCDNTWVNQPIIFGKTIFHQKKNMKQQRINIGNWVFELSHIWMDRMIRIFTMD